MDSELSPLWRKTFYSLWIGCFITGMGFSMTMPFVSLFINELGNFSKFQLNFYSGLAFGATFVSQAIVSPLWGEFSRPKRAEINVYAGLWGNGLYNLYHWTFTVSVDDYWNAIFTGCFLWIH